MFYSSTTIIHIIIDPLPVNSWRTLTNTEKTFKIYFIHHIPCSSIEIFSIFLFLVENLVKRQKKWEMNKLEFFLFFRFHYTISRLRLSTLALSSEKKSQRRSKNNFVWRGIPSLKLTSSRFDTRKFQWIKKRRQKSWDWDLATDWSLINNNWRRDETHIIMKCVQKTKNDKRNLKFQFEIQPFLAHCLINLTFKPAFINSKLSQRIFYFSTMRTWHCFPLRQ